MLRGREYVFRTVSFQTWDCSLQKFPEHNFDNEFSDKSGAQHRTATRSVAATERSEGANQLGVFGGAVSRPPPPMGARGEAPENFGFFSTLDPWKSYFWLCKFLSAKPFFTPNLPWKNFFLGPQMKISWNQEFPEEISCLVITRLTKSSFFLDATNSDHA